MRVEFWAETDAGRVREHNEDNFLVDADLGLFVVCDGMGGHAAGEVASAMSVQTVHDTVRAEQARLEGLSRNPEGNQERKAVLEMLQRGIRTASERVYGAASRDAERRGMGTTCSLMLVREGRGFVAHVGDSRIYRVRSGGVEQLTEDHSLINEMIRRGQVRRGDSIPNENAVTRAVGVRRHIEVDAFEVDLEPGDVIVLCSDGLSEYLQDGDLLDLTAADDPEAIAGACIEHAIDGGGKDNVTAVVVEALADGATEATPASRLLEALGATRIFSGAAARELVPLRAVAEHRTVAAGERIGGRGSPEPALCLVEEGAVELDGGEGRPLEFGEGDVFGARSLFLEGARAPEFIAREATELVALPREPLYQVLRSHPGLANKFFYGLADHLAHRWGLAVSAEIVRDESAPEEGGTSPPPLDEGGLRTTQAVTDGAGADRTAQPDGLRKTVKLNKVDRGDGDSDEI